MYLELIRQMQQQGAYYASLAHIDAFRLRFGNPPELQRLQADALRETGQTEAASKAYQSLLHGNQAAAAWHGLGLIAATGKQYDLAEQDLQQAVQLDPINVAFLSDLGYARLSAGRIEEAREPLAKAAELEPANVKVISNLALWVLLQGDDAQADAIMQRANLPQATRDAIQKLAVQLRPTAATRSVTDAPTASVKQATPHSALPQTASIPGMLLDRGTTPASSEVRP
ncbi:Flp pilus assembly protein TadD [Dyella tabacisoli]|uniref:Flp pilus assembly protein TadD n=2 Tax=Dyella tabacisoli TaxID=2282381 RepID=A0A369UM36_9GAMM|nr:Flp pilus assembly protein TadD [Dyella tabacisoli]